MKKIYEETKEFWNEQPCGSTHMPDLFRLNDKKKYFASFDKYFWNLYPYVKPFMDYKKMKGKTVLEIGLGSGTTLGESCKYARKVYGVDLSNKTIELNSKRKEIYHLDNLKLINCSATKLPFPDESIDIVVSLGCIHHIQEAGKVFEEIYRVLKKGGSFKGMVYNRDSYRAKYFIPKEMRWNIKWKGYSQQEVINEMYDGKGNPYAKLYSKREVLEYLRNYRKVKFFQQNFVGEELTKYNIVLSVLLKKAGRNFYLKTLGRIMGIDLFFNAIK